MTDITSSALHNHSQCSQYPWMVCLPFYRGKIRPQRIWRTSWGSPGGSSEARIWTQVSDSKPFSLSSFIWLPASWRREAKGWNIYRNPPLISKIDWSQPIGIGVLMVWVLKHFTVIWGLVSETFLSGVTFKALCLSRITYPIKFKLLISSSQKDLN